MKCVDCGRWRSNGEADWFFVMNVTMGPVFNPRIGEPVLDLETRAVAPGGFQCGACHDLAEAKRPRQVGEICGAPIICDPGVEEGTLELHGSLDGVPFVHKLINIGKVSE